MSLLERLKEKYKEKNIYYFVGDLLLSLNPFENLDLYNDNMVKSYRKEQISDPHIYQIGKSNLNQFFHI